MASLNFCDIATYVACVNHMELELKLVEPLDWSKFSRIGNTREFESFKDFKLYGTPKRKGK